MTAHVLAAEIAGHLRGRIGPLISDALTGPSQKLAAVLSARHDRVAALKFAEEYGDMNHSAAADFVRTLTPSQARDIASHLPRYRRAPADHDIERFADDITDAGGDFADVRATYLRCTPAQRRELLDAFAGE